MLKVMARLLTWVTGWFSEHGRLGLEVGSAGVGRVEAMGERRRPRLSSWEVCPDLTESPDVWLQNLYSC